jgi:hypothetical protein
MTMSTLTLSTIRQNLTKFDYTGLGIPVLVLLIMAMLVLPLPPLLLDFLFTFNIVVSLVIIMICHRHPQAAGLFIFSDHLVVCHHVAFGPERRLYPRDFGGRPLRVTMPLAKWWLRLASL